MYGKYADLESVLASVEGPLAQEGVLIMQSCVEVNERLYLRTSLIHTATGQSIHNDLPILMKNPNNPQELGGAMTYARRYGIISILSIVADDDDDGNTAAGKQADGFPKAQKAVVVTKGDARANPQTAPEGTPPPATTAPEGTPGANLLTEKMVTALITEFERAGYSGSEIVPEITRVVGRNFGQLYNLTEAEGRAAVKFARNNPK